MTETDGWITIGTKLDSKQLEKDIREEEKKLKTFEKELEKLTQKKIELEVDINEKYKAKIKEISKEYELGLKKALSDLKSANAAGMGSTYGLGAKDRIQKEFEEEKNAKIKEATEEYKKQMATVTELNNQIEKNTYQQGLINSNIKEMNVELQKSKNFSNMQKNIEGVGKSVERVAKKVVSWGLALLGVRGAYSLISRAMTTLTSQDDQLKADVDYMRNSIAYALEPVIRKIIELMKTMMIIVRDIVYELTGKNIFENANKSLTSANKQVKEMGKTLAGFDEMNIVGSQSGTSTVTPSFDLSNMGDVDEKAQKKKEEIKNFWKDIGEFWEKDWVDFFTTSDSHWNLFVRSIGLTLEGFYLVFKGIIDVIVGIVQWFIALFTGDLDKLMEATKKIGKGLLEFVVGIFDILFGALMSLVGLIYGVVADLVGGIVNKVVEMWNGLKNILSQWGSWIYDHVIKPVGDFFAGLWEGVKNSFSNAWEFIKNAFSKGGQLFNGLKDGIVDTFKIIVNTLINGINRVIRIPFDLINGLLNKIRNSSFLGISPFKNLWGENPLPVPQIPRLAKGGIINMPGKGVMMGSAIAGERGQEGVIPLTDSQQMALLGEAIGKYITVDITNVTNLDGRQIARKVDKIKQNNNFVLNR